MTRSTKAPMRNGIREQSNGSYELKFDLPRGADGKRRTRSVTFYGTRTDAKNHRLALIADARRGALPDPRRVTVEQQINTWLDGPARMNASPKTYERYRDTCVKRLIPCFGNTLLRKLTAAMVQQQIYDWLENGRADGGGGLAWTTVAQMRAVLHAAVGIAVPELIATNIVAETRMPRRGAVGTNTQTEKQARALSPTECGKLIDAVTGTWVEVPTLLALATGMRRGELLGLKWEHVDLDKGVLRVRNSLEQTRGGLRIKGPKTKAGRRAIKLAESSVALLRRHRRAQLQQRLELGIGGRPEMVFNNAYGDIVNPHTFSKKFLALTKDIHCTFHTLRHTHASDLLRNGVPITTVARRLGHERPSTTLDVYSHMLPDDQDTATDVIDRLYGGR